jgi:DNA-directed RNA polymerase subunit M/transcription elongation factor TFIIS
MNFCDYCGSFLKQTAEGLWCPKCGKTVRSKSKVRSKSVKKADSTAVYVIDKPEESSEKVSRVCPNCGNGEALHWFSGVSGEHAGVRRERTVEHFKCTECSHSWVKTS